MTSELPDTLRILYVNHVGRSSGAENSLVSLIRHLDRERFSPVAAVPDGPLAEQLATLGARVKRIDGLRLHQTLNPFSALAQYRRLRRMRSQIQLLSDEAQAQLVHANSLTVALAMGLKGRAGPPVIWHCRDLLVDGRVIRWVGPRCTEIVAISAVVREKLIDACPALRNHVRVIYNGISPEEFLPQRPREQVRAELGCPHDAQVVAMVGQLVPWKRHDLLLEAADTVLAHRRGTRFWVIGEDMFGEHRRYVSKLKSSAPGAVSFLGYREDVADLVAAADIVAHPTTAEPLGRAVLEAMSLSKPVVAARAGGPAELIEHEQSGLLVEPASARALANGILTLLSDRDLAQRLGENARQRVQQHFSATATAARMEELYLDVAQEALG